MKRIFDIVVSLVGIVVLLPLMAAIAVAIRLESKGAAIFAQRRAGWYGRPFTMLKFRTMRTDVEAYGQSPHSSDDPRLTRVGRFLREGSLDELPQLFNVLVGQMSLVGPRPLYERQAALWDAHQRRRLDVRPGISGYAQAYGRAKLTHRGKIELDVFYVDNQSGWLDLKILARTVANIFGRRGETYEHRYDDDAVWEGDHSRPDACAENGRKGGPQDGQA